MKHFIVDFFEQFIVDLLLLAVPTLGYYICNSKYGPGFISCLKLKKKTSLKILKLGG